MNFDDSYTLIMDFLKKHDRPVMYIEQVDGKTVREFEHPNPPLKAIAHKLMLFAEEMEKKENILKTKLDQVIQECDNYKMIVEARQHT